MGKAVDWYLKMMPLAANLAEGKQPAHAVKDAQIDAPEDALIVNQQEYEIIYPRMRRAKIFEIRPTTYAALHHLADVYTTEELLQEKWASYPQPGWNRTDQDTYTYGMALKKGAGNVPFPDNLPFEQTYFGYAEPIRLTEAGEVARRINLSELSSSMGASGVRLLGQMVCTETQRIWEFLAGENDQGTAVGIITIPVYKKGLWVYPMSLDAWIVSGLVGVLNDPKMTTEISERPVSKKKWRRAQRGGMKDVPKKYYVVEISANLSKTKNRKILPHALRQSNEAVQWTHQWDSRAHERLLVQRGSYPLSNSKAEDLVDREYKLYTGELDTWAKDQLKSRQLPGPGPGEWVALKSIKVKASVKGPADKPYVPAMWRLKESPRAKAAMDAIEDVA